MGDSTETSNKGIRFGKISNSTAKIGLALPNHEAFRKQQLENQFERKNKTNHDDSGQNGYAFGMSVNIKSSFLIGITHSSWSTPSMISRLIPMITPKWLWVINLGFLLETRLSPLLKQTALIGLSIPMGQKTSDKKCQYWIDVSVDGLDDSSLTPQFEQGNSNTSAAYQKTSSSKWSWFFDFHAFQHHYLLILSGFVHPAGGCWRSGTGTGNGPG